MIQVASVDVFDDDVHLFVHFYGVDEAHDAFMVQFGKYFAFLLQCLHAMHLLKQLFGFILLDGNLLAIKLVLGAFDHAK